VGEFDTCLAMKVSRLAAGYDGMTYGIFKGCNEDMKTLFLKIPHYSGRIEEEAKDYIHSKTWQRYIHQLI
jgi:hypothetical protein